MFRCVERIQEKYAEEGILLYQRLVHLKALEKNSEFSKADVFQTWVRDNRLALSSEIDLLTRKVIYQ